MNRELRAVRDGDGFSIVNQADGLVTDWVAAPRDGTQRDGDTDSYVRIAEKPELWPPEARWVVTEGQRVRQTGGLREGRTGTIVGQGRSRKADRIFASSLAEAEAAGRDLTDDDFEILVDNEGPVIRWDDETGLDWFPGQAMGLLEPE